MIRPASAPVRPRVVSPETGDAVLLEDEILSLAESRGPLVVELLGGNGAGKTMALSHLARIAKELSIVLLDNPDDYAPLRRDDHDGLIVFSARMHRGEPDITLALAPWREDEWIEYLLAVHPKQCGSVMQRVQRDDFRRTLQGVPRLWRIVLDELAADTNLLDVRGALRRHLDKVMPTRYLRSLMGQYSRHLLLDEPIADEFYRLPFRHDHPAQLSILRHRPVQLLLGADETVNILTSDKAHTISAQIPAHDLLVEIAHVAQGSPTAIEQLHQLLWSEHEHLCPLAGSVLHAAGELWRPRIEINLAYAQLPDIQWPRADLTGANLFRANLNGADLSGATLQDAKLGRVSLARANLAGASLRDAVLQHANLNGVNAARANATGANFSHAELQQASLCNALLQSADLSHADLTGADCSGAVLQKALLQGANIEDAIFTDVDFQEAVLRGVPLRKACCESARFVRAKLDACDLEFVHWPDAALEEADLTGALLTGSVLPGVNLQNARLCYAGVADIVWEDADLRGADLRGCKFHMGSSRSGLVGSPFPGHGSKTGFYTDEFDQRYFRSPEEIRKANLCGADLRGALIEGVDFYLVDLRGAKLDPDQVEHLRRCDAILDDRG